MNDQELSRMWSLEAIANRYVAEADELRSKLLRFEEREPLVQELLAAFDTCPNCDVVDEMCDRCNSLLIRVKAFVLQPSNPALDPVTKTEVDK